MEIMHINYWSLYIKTSLKQGQTVIKTTVKKEGKQRRERISDDSPLGEQKTWKKRKINIKKENRK